MYKNLLRTVPVSGYHIHTALNLAGGHPLLAVLQELSKNPTQFSRKVRNLLSGSILNVTRGLSGQSHYRREMYSMWLVGCQSFRISAARPHKVNMRVHMNIGAVSCRLMGFGIGKLGWYRDFQLRAVRLLDLKVQDFIEVRYDHVLKNLLQ